MGEPETEKQPEDKPDHPHEGGPPGQNPDFVPPGQGGTPPGQDKPDKPEEPDEGEAPHPEHPIADPDDIPEPTPQTAARAETSEAPPEEGPAAAVEPNLGMEEYATLTLARKGFSPAVQEAGKAALKTWLRRYGPGGSGHYSHAEWEEHFSAAMRHS